MRQGIPPHVLVERIHFLITNAVLEATAGRYGHVNKELGEALDLINDLRGAIQ